MPYNNTNKNTDKEFYKEVAKRLNVTPDTVKRYWIDGFYDAIVLLVYRDGICRLPNLGTFTSIHEEECYQSQKDENGEKVTYLVPARDKPVFREHNDFIDDINFMAVTKAARKRVRKNQLNANDYRRIQRASALGSFGSMTPARAEKAQDDLLKLIEEKKKENEDGKT